MSATSNSGTPDSWRTVELGELVTVAYGKALAAGSRSSDGNVPVVGSSGIVGNHNEALVTGSCLVVGRKGAAGATHLISCSSWPIDTAYFIQPPSDLSLTYLYYWLGSQRLGALDKSTAIPSLSRDDLYRVLVPVAPTKEQTRIVAKLEELLSGLDAGVAELKAAQKKLAQYRQSLLKAAVQGDLTADWRAKQKAVRAEPVVRQARHDRHPATVRAELVEARPSTSSGRTDVAPETGAELLARILKQRRECWQAKQLAKSAEQGKPSPTGWQDKYPEPAAPNTRDLPALPEGWAWASIEQIADVGTGVTPSRAKAAYFQNGTTPWVTSGALNGEFVTAGSELVSDAALEECRLEIYPTGSLLLAMYGEGKTRGKCSELMIPAAINQAIAAIVLEDGAAKCRRFLKIFLLASYERMREQAAGGVQPNLNLQIVKAIAVPLPPASEQEAIAERLGELLSGVADQVRAVQTGIKQSTAQRQNILRAAFAGQLVPQDPSDEPASVLLKRIRAERGTSTKVLTRKKRVGP